MNIKKIANYTEKVFKLKENNTKIKTEIMKKLM